MLTKVIEDDFEDFLAQSQEKLSNSDDITLVVLELKNKERIRIEFESRLEKMEQVEAEVLDFVRPYCEELMEFKMGLHEILANAIEHGNHLDITKKVGLKVFAAKGYIRIIIKDEGLGFDTEEKLARTLVDAGCQGRGRGIIIAQSIFDQIYYNRKGNEVCLIKFI